MLLYLLLGGDENYHGGYKGNSNTAPMVSCALLMLLWPHLDILALAKNSMVCFGSGWIERGYDERRVRKVLCFLQREVCWSLFFWVRTPHAAGVCVRIICTITLRISLLVRDRTSKGWSSKSYLFLRIKMITYIRPTLSLSRKDYNRITTINQCRKACSSFN